VDLFTNNRKRHALGVVERLIKKILVNKVRVEVLLFFQELSVKLTFDRHTKVAALKMAIDKLPWNKSKISADYTRSDYMFHETQQQKIESKVGIVVTGMLHNFTILIVLTENIFIILA